MKARRIAVTGAKGFIGGNLVRALGGRDCSVTSVDFDDRDAFAAALERGELALDAVCHQGAITDTTLRDEALMLRENHEYSRRILRACLQHGIRLVYASSAAVYGNRHEFHEDAPEAPAVNAYALSKLLFDREVRLQLPGARTQIVGLRYFNVYGLGESHKGKMASVAYQLFQQLHQSGRVRLFGASHGLPAGEQRRDFVTVEDVVLCNLHFLEHPELSGIFNVGTGVSRSFNEVARAVISAAGAGEIEYLPFPAELLPHYQSHTQADLGRLRAAGFRHSFTAIEDGIRRYVSALSVGLQSPLRS
jgi:ADP-L-glycero-D-manno-heptose 6-epimerase